jgi:hypothetical protein
MTQCQCCVTGDGSPIEAVECCTGSMWRRHFQNGNRLPAQTHPSIGAVHRSGRQSCAKRVGPCCVARPGLTYSNLRQQWICSVSFTTLARLHPAILRLPTCGE